MCQEILLIKNIYDRYVNLLMKYLLPQSVNIVEEYMGGFITFGQLQNDTIISRSFDTNYISFQIKYRHNLYFFDFFHNIYLVSFLFYPKNLHWHRRQ